MFAMTIGNQLLEINCHHSVFILIFEKKALMYIALWFVQVTISLPNSCESVSLLPNAILTNSAYGCTLFLDFTPQTDAA